MMETTEVLRLDDLESSKHLTVVGATPFFL